MKKRGNKKKRNAGHCFKFCGRGFEEPAETARTRTNEQVEGTNLWDQEFSESRHPLMREKESRRCL